MSNNECVLVISDLHEPYGHPDAYDFLKAVKSEYGPDKVVCVGDEVDHHALSFHDTDADLLSAGGELEVAINRLKKLYKLFPEVDVIDSNHGSMAIRKFKHHGIPLKYLKGVGEVLEAPDGWNWTRDLKLDLSDGSQVYFHHGLKKNTIQVAQQMGMNVVQGHFHESFGIQYSSSPSKLIWAMQVGCLIDNNSLAFAYNRTNLGRPLLGVGLIVYGQPVLVPMLLDNKGKWIQEII